MQDVSWAGRMDEANGLLFSVRTGISQKCGIKSTRHRHDDDMMRDTFSSKQPKFLFLLSAVVCPPLVSPTRLYRGRFLSRWLVEWMMRFLWLRVRFSRENFTNCETETAYVLCMCVVDLNKKGTLDIVKYIYIYIGVVFLCVFFVADLKCVFQIAADGGLGVWFFK